MVSGPRDIALDVLGGRFTNAAAIGTVTALSALMRGPSLQPCGVCTCDGVHERCPPPRDGLGGRTLGPIVGFLLLPATCEPANPTVIEIASMYDFTRRMSPACGMIPNDEYYVLAR